MGDAGTQVLTISKKKSLHQVSFLRMVAAISVCLFHIVNGNRAFLPVKKGLVGISEYGYLGIYIFFIISGFIICYSLPTNYSIKDLPVFFKKRLLRVEPPYLASIAITLIVIYLAAGYTHNPVGISWINVLYHVGYINNFTTTGYINVVYWTLGIEFQFYIIIGLLFTFINRSIYWLSFIIIAFLALSFVSIPNIDVIFEYLPLFCAGILMFYLNFSEKYPKLLLLLLLAATFGIIALHGIAVFTASLFTVLVILIPMRKYNIVNFLSMISFSLYLTHVPVGGRVINLLMRFAKTDMQRYGVIIVALGVSIATAYVFYLIIEKWTTELSKKIKYRNSIIIKP